MNKFLSIALSLVLAFSIVPMALVSVSAEDYDYYTVYDAETATELPATHSHAKVELVDDTIRNDSVNTKMVSVKRTSDWNWEPNLVFSGNYSEINADSIGVRVWIAGEVEMKQLAVIMFGKTVGGTTTYYADYNEWGPYSVGDVTAEGAWYTYLWGDRKLAIATVSENGKRVVPNTNTASANNVIDADFLSNMTNIALFFDTPDGNSAYTNKGLYADDVQFIYPEGKAPSSGEPETPSETDGLTTDAIATQDSASIRINEVSGMRFYTTVDTTALADLGKVTERGTLIGPADKVGTYLTIEDTEIPEGETVGNAVAVKYDLDKDLWENDEMVGSLVGIQEKNYTRDFVARAYVVVDGVYYYSKTTATKNVADIADAYLATNPKLDEVTSALVNSWAAAND